MKPSQEPTFLLLMTQLVLMKTHEIPVVNVTGGQVRGRSVHQPGAQVENYYAFEGMRYARPPVGDLRFKDPKEVEPWSGIQNATSPGSICIQKRISNQEIIGHEDCLFINVYTAHPPSSWLDTKNPVLVWIHPGTFSEGWSHLDFLGADDLLHLGIVVVSFNYRLGVLGFLNTEDNAAPGNAGLKDSVAALRWVKNNIAGFGGNPRKVTVLGYAAGGAMVHYLLLSPLSKGLLHRAVSMSGSALAPWAIASHPRKHALAMRKRFAPSCPDHAPDAVVSCLQSVDASRLVASQHSFSPEELGTRFLKNPFLPSVEDSNASDSPFLPAQPEQLIRAGRFLHVPYVTGFANAEGIYFLKQLGLVSNSTMWSDIDTNFENIFRSEMPPHLRTNAAARQMRDFYLGDQPLKEDQEQLRRFVELCTDLFVSTSSISAARLMAQSGAPVYMYNIEHTSQSPILVTQLRNASLMAGVAHGEDLPYTFQFSQQPSGPTLIAYDDESTIRHQILRLVVNFVSNGDLSLQEGENNQWHLYTLQEENFLVINTTLIMRDHILGQRIAFWRHLTKCDETEVCEIHPIVAVEEGRVRGRKQGSLANCSFYSWQGMPYAQSPVGPQRFTDAKHPQNWKGVRDALQEGSICAQWNGQRVEGSEDCLFVNVYTPRLPMWLSDTLPVMLWIHGGGFVSGSGDQQHLGPDFLVCEEIMFVSFNYRLGVLGFLYMESAAPGNAGMKDQVLAQRWVQKNIAAFGGDPDKVTLTGESAGGASVHLHMLSPMTAGLFHRAIAQSGSALNPWANQLDPVTTARRLANELNCTMSDFNEVVHCLRSIHLENLIPAAVLKAPTEKDQKRMLCFTFVPTTDFIVPGIETFLPLPAYELVKNNAHHAVPFLTGFTSLESALDLAFQNFRDPHIAIIVDSSWNSLILTDLRLPSNSTRSEEVLYSLRQFFMDGKPLSQDTLYQFLNMLTDIHFSEGIYFSIRHMAEANKAPLLQYSFEVDDALNMLKIKFHMMDLVGAAHADDKGYLFRISHLPNVTAASSAAIGRRRMVKLWTNFVKTGNPTYDDDPLLGSVRWLNYTNEDKNYLEIGDTLRLKTNLNKERIIFWEQFYETYGNESA